MNLLHAVSGPWRQALAALAVPLSAPGEGMLRLDAVELGPPFNKPRSNLLLRRRPGQPDWELFVDDDLQYLGSDEMRQRLFSGPRFQHWVALALPHPLRGDVHEALRESLCWLESPLVSSLPSIQGQGSIGRWPGALEPGLAEVGRLRGAADLAIDGCTLSSTQAETADHVAAAVTQSLAPCCPLLIGQSGCGKHFLARAAAAATITRGLFQQVLEISGAALAAGMLFRQQQDERVGRVLDAALELEKTLLLFDQFDAVFEMSDIAGALLARALERGLKLIGIARGQFELDHVETMLSLQRRLRPVCLPPMDRGETIGVLRGRLAGHPLAARVELSAGLIPAIACAAERRPGANPGAALDLLDALLAQAAWSGAAVIGPDDLLHLQPPDE
jgi:hypothetical protein